MKRLSIASLVIGFSLAAAAQTQRLDEASAEVSAPVPAQVQAAPMHPAVELAKSLLGVPYRWAGSDPLRGFDCSGLVQYVFRQLQVQLPRMSRELFVRTEPIAPAELRPGDLLFFHTFARLSHVGIYIGGGRFIHAPRKGTVVRVESMDSKYYSKRYAGARRVAQAEGTASTASASPVVF